jgi:hypothetical protein
MIDQQFLNQISSELSAMRDGIIQLKQMELIMIAYFHYFQNSGYFPIRKQKMQKKILDFLIMN